MSDDKAKLTLQYSAENRKNEIALLWSRALYFWGFSTVLITAYGAAIANHKTLAAFAGCFGIVSSLCWSLVNRGSRYWQSVWETKTEASEMDVLSRQIFHRRTNPYVEARWFWGARQYSASKLALAMSDFSVVGWTCLVLGTMVSRLIPNSYWVVIPFVIITNLLLLLITALAVVTVLLWCRSGDPMSLKWAWMLVRATYRRMKHRIAAAISKLRHYRSTRCS